MGMNSEVITILRSLENFLNKCMYMYIVLLYSSADSRRTSHAPSTASRRYSSMLLSSRDALNNGNHQHRKSTSSGIDLPGIQISRFETLDIAGSSHGRGSLCSIGSKRYIVIHSDLPSEFARLSNASDYSLTGSRSSRSRSSRASSAVSSRLWDFSPRDSEGDADIALGSRDSQQSVAKQDWSGGPSHGSDPHCYMLSPSSARKTSVVTFDITANTTDIRRHSSPSVRRKEGTLHECACSSQAKSKMASSKPQKPTKSVLVNGTGQWRKHTDDVTNRNVLSSANCQHSTDRSAGPLTTEDKVTESIANVDQQGPVNQSLPYDYDAPNRYRRPVLRRHNTDDSEVERRVAQIFKDIEFSATDSVDDLRPRHSLSSDYDRSYGGRVERCDTATQTMTESELQQLLQHQAGNPNATQENFNQDTNKQNIRVFNETAINATEKRAGFAKASGAFTTIGSSSQATSRVPTRILVHGLSVDDLHGNSQL